jgi:uridine kinase
MTDLRHKRELLDDLAAEILHSHGASRAIVAIDGVDAAGKTYFADELAESFGRAHHPVLRASIDDFHRSRAERYASGTHSPEGFYRDSYNYEIFRQVLVDPFRAGSGGLVLAAFDHVRDTPIVPAPVTAATNTTLIIDGIFLQRPELRGLWDYTVWLDVPTGIAESRALHRDGPTGVGDRYTGGQALYRAEAAPMAAANAVIDNSDFERPRRIVAGTA